MAACAHISQDPQQRHFRLGRVWSKDAAVSFSALGEQPAVLDTAESVVIDGANGVTQAPRQHFPEAGWAIGAAVIVAALTLMLRRARAAMAIRVVSGLLLLGSAPGLIQVFGARADAPLHRPRVAEAVRSTLNTLAAAAPWPAPIEVVREDDDVLFPLGRYAVPVRARSRPQALEVIIRGSRLQLSCSTPHQGEPVVCEPPK